MTARCQAVLGLLALALLLCGLNAHKPLTVDDSVYHEYARHIADHPLDPYGFCLGPGAQPANEVLAPPVLLYWWAAALRLAGHHIGLWKLSLLPFCLLLVFSFAGLARRFARGLEVPLTALVVLSPAVLPCLNLMLDLPALALGLAAVWLFLASCDRGAGRVGFVLAAGLVAALAMQTKYTAFVVPAVFLLAGLLYRRPWSALLATLLALGLFASWEAFVAQRYGVSHFVVAVLVRKGAVAEKLRLALPLVGILGGTFASGALVSLAGLRVRPLVGVGVCLLVAASYLALALVPSAHAGLLVSPGGRAILTVNSLAFGSLGALVLGLAGVTLVRLLRDPLEEEGRRQRLLLVGWVVLEVAAYFVLSPYQAVRRVLGVVAVGTLAGGCLLRGREPNRASRWLLWQAVAVSAVTGLIGFAVDRDLYRLEEKAADRVVRWVRARDERGQLWFEGMGALEFAGTRLGMCRLDVPGAAPHPGDWLAVPVVRMGAAVRREALGGAWVREGEMRLKSRWPLRSCYQYGGTPLEHQEGPLLEVAVYRYRPPASARNELWAGDR